MCNSEVVQQPLLEMRARKSREAAATLEGGALNYQFCAAKSTKMQVREPRGFCLFCSMPFYIVSAETNKFLILNYTGVEYIQYTL